MQRARRSLKSVQKEGFDYGYGTDSTNFIPEDRLRMIFAMDENEGMLDCSIDASISYDTGLRSLTRCIAQIRSAKWFVRSYHCGIKESLKDCQ